MHSSSTCRAAATVLVLALFTAAVRAQCDAQWLPGDGLPGVNGSVAVMATWDPDGPGPATQRVVMAGAFTVAGTAAASGIAAWDPATGAWSAFGAGVTNVRAMVALPTGALVVGGSFTQAGGVAASHLAVWQNGVWSQLGGGVSDWVEALAVTPSGDLLVGGRFTTVGGLAKTGLARWDGAAWHDVGPALGVGTTVECVTVRADGTVFVAGSLSPFSAGPHSVAQWDGATWTVLATAPVEANALVLMQNGDLVLGGSFFSFGGPLVNNLARWNGTSWSILGGTFVGTVYALAVRPNGDLIATGQFNNILVGPQSIDVYQVARWNGTAWSSMGGIGLQSGGGQALVALANGNVVAGGHFHIAGSTRTLFVAQWNGSVWSRLATGFDGPVLAFARTTGGDWYAGGAFTIVGAQEAFCFARWNGSTWTPAASNSPAPVHALLPLPNGELVAAAWHYTTPQTLNSVVRWNGAVWQQYGTGLVGEVQALARMPNGDIVAGGGPLTANGVALGTLARWNGSAWSSLGVTGIPAGIVRALGLLPSGHLVAAGTLSSAGGQPVLGIARWDGASWFPIGTGVADVTAMAILGNGNIVVGSGSSFVGQVKLWNGAFWWNLGATANAPVDVLTVVRDNALLAGGRFTTIGGVSASRLARWNGTTWSAIGGGVSGAVTAIGVKSSGEIALGGEFFAANGIVTPYVARLQLPCAPAAVVAGAGCPSSGGANLLEVESPAWLGSTFRARGTGLPALALVSVITGFTPISVPLAALLPQGVAGCNLLVSPDYLYFTVAQGGEVTTAIPLPSTPALVGASFFHQLNPVEVDGSLNILAVTASNALQLTTGWF